MYSHHSTPHIILYITLDELNMIVSSVELGLIFYKIKDHTYTGQMNRSRILRLLCVDRVSELNVPARAMVLDGMQRMKISAHPERYVECECVLFECVVEVLRITRMKLNGSYH